MTLGAGLGSHLELLAFLNFVLASVAQGESSFPFLPVLPRSWYAHTVDI